MKILNVSFADSAGAAFGLCHALNKEGYSAVNLRSNDNYLNYPTIANMRNYDMETVRRMILKTDVLVFHTAMAPLIKAFNLAPNDMSLEENRIMAEKKKLIYFHGSDCRQYGEEILEQADYYWGDYEILVSTPDLLSYVQDHADHANWLPVARSFTEISSKYGLSWEDKVALDRFGEPFLKTILGHAPTNPEIKGTHIFLRVITKVVEKMPNGMYLPIQMMPWDSCLRTMASMDIFYDQCLLGAYGTAAVEASIFKMPVVCLLKPEVQQIMEKESGLSSPFIQFASEDELEYISIKLCEEPDLRKKFGESAYDYCRAMHDEAPVVTRFMDIVAKMP